MKDVMVRRITAGLCSLFCAAISPMPAGADVNTHAKDASVSVGAIFVGGSQDHSCSASVINSSSGNTIITAAHCVSGDGTNLTFVPAYSHGHRPFGTWNVIHAYAPSGWLKNHSENSDYVVLQVADKNVNGTSINIQDVVGGYRIANSAQIGSVIKVIGYNSGKNDKAVKCTTTLKTFGDFKQFDCSTAFSTGTSGSPWVTQNGSLAGVIGGKDQGGCSDTTSYSSSLSASSLSALIARAERHDKGDVLPGVATIQCP